ncbi:MAG: response regulator transcription factor [Pseudomonadota bacterium]
MERTMERAMERAIEQAIERAMERAMERTMERVYDVIVVEDDEQTRQGLSHLLMAHPDFELAGTAADLESATRLVDERCFDLLLLDLCLGHESGLPLIARAAPAKTLVLSLADDAANVLSAIEAGAVGYLTKDEPAERIVASIQDALAGHAPLSSAIAGHLLRRVRSAHREREDALDPLSPRELEVLQHLARGSSYLETASELEISIHTVSFHVRQIYGKLQVSSRGEAVFEAARSGMIAF